MNRDGKIWNWLVWTMFILLVGIGLGMFWRVKQIEPNLAIAQAEIKQSYRLMAKDLTDLDIRLSLIEKKVYGIRTKK